MPKSIMIVDDSAIVRRGLRQLFTGSEEWTIAAEAVDGRDAVEKAQRLHFDFVVIDFSMPVMNGLETISQLKEISPGVAIVMLTAFKNTSLEQKAYEAGASWVLSKTEDSLSKVLDFARILVRPSKIMTHAIAPGVPH